MANQFSKTDQRRITFLSLLSSAASMAAAGDMLPGDTYSQAGDWLAQMEDDGFFEAEVRSERPPTRRPSSGRSAGSRRPASSSRQSSGGNGGFSGNMRDPSGPPTDKQVAKVFSLTQDYTEDELYDMTKADVSALIEDLLS